MPRNRDRNKKHELDIYVILSEISDAFIVWKIKSGNAYTAYKDHARMKSLYTAYGGGQRPLVRSRTAAVRSE